MTFKLIFRKAIPLVLTALLVFGSAVHPAIADDEVTDQPVVESTGQPLANESLPTDSVEDDLTQGNQNDDTGTLEETLPSEPVPVSESPSPAPQESFVTAAEPVQTEPDYGPSLAAVYGPDLTPVNAAVNGYGSLARIAEKELMADDNTEFPLQSDCVKYNTWAWERRVCNPFSQGEYEEKYPWDTSFVSWCANESGYVQFHKFPHTSSGSELFAWFSNHGSYLASSNELKRANSSFKPERDDLIFFVNNGLYNTGIITDFSKDVITYIAGNSSNTVEEITLLINDMPDDAFVVHWKNEHDYLVPYMKYLCDEIGMTPVAAVGTLANIQCESRFNPHSLGDGETSYGLCQWHNGRWTALVDVCNAAGMDWTTTEGQLYFLKTEFINHYQWLLEQMNACEGSKEGASQAGFLFCIGLERPAGMEDSGRYRGYLAAETLYPDLIVDY